MSLYLDHAATTPLDSDVLQEMMPYFTEFYGNASSLYREGQYAKQAMDEAKFSIGQNIDCNLDEIVFTSGATESNNMAIRGVVSSFQKSNPEKIPHIISTEIEHPAVKEVLQKLEIEKKITLSLLSVDSNGIISIDELKETIGDETILVSVMAVNNEIGSVQPIARIGKICTKQNILFHVDAVQAMGNIHVSVEHWKCDMMSLSAHKCYGPKGVGLLYIKAGTEIDSLLWGGAQERGYRAGTENVAGAVGMAKAIEISVAQQETESVRQQNLQRFTKEYIEKNISLAQWNGAEIGENRSTANCNFSFAGVDGESLLMRLDLKGVSVSLGSACSAGMMKSSYVLEAIGRNEEEAKSSLRITFGRSTQKEELEKGLEKIVDGVLSLMS